jgi:hypothetical protein
MKTTIRKDDRIRIKPEWQEPGDDKFIWVAVEDEDGGRVRIAPANIGLTIPANQVVDTRMAELAS